MTCTNFVTSNSRPCSPSALATLKARVIIEAASPARYTRGEWRRSSHRGGGDALQQCEINRYVHTAGTLR